MLINLLDPVILCFALGVMAGLFRVPLSLPKSTYEFLSIYLLLAIGLKGGVELSQSAASEVVVPILASIFLAGLITLIANVYLRLGKLSRYDAAAIAAHYGSVSAVTFAVATKIVAQNGLPTNSFMTAIMAVMEIPGILIAVLLVKSSAATTNSRHASRNIKKLMHEVFFGKSLYLLLGGLAVGLLAGKERMSGVEPLFVDLFKGFLAFFLLELGIVAANQMRELKKVGAFLVVFAITMPLMGAFLGAIFAFYLGFPVGSAVILATLAASSSYIAAPTAMRIAIPEANPSFYITASLGVTFPFNLSLGIPIYIKICEAIYGT